MRAILCHDRGRELESVVNLSRWESWERHLVPQANVDYSVGQVNLLDVVDDNFFLQGVRRVVLIKVLCSVLTNSLRIMTPAGGQLGPKLLGTKRFTPASFAAFARAISGAGENGTRPLMTTS
jgi:hypothetical protein